MLRGRSGDRGLTLIELAVAILVLSIGAIAATRAGDGGIRALGGAMPRLLTAIAAENRAEELRAFGAGAQLPDMVTMGGRDIALEVTREATAGGLILARIAARAEGGEGTILTAFLPAQGTAR